MSKEHNNTIYNKLIKVDLFLVKKLRAIKLFVNKLTKFLINNYILNLVKNIANDLVNIIFCSLLFLKTIIHYFIKLQSKYCAFFSFKLIFNQKHFSLHIGC